MIIPLNIKELFLFVIYLYNKKFFSLYVDEKKLDIYENCVNIIINKTDKGGRNER